MMTGMNIFVYEHPIFKLIHFLIFNSNCNSEKVAFGLCI